MPARSKPVDMAVALVYRPVMAAPVISASLQGPAALRAQALARESGVPVIQDANVAAVLLPFDVGTLVPPEYWELVARVFVAVAAMGGTSA